MHFLLKLDHFDNFRVNWQIFGTSCTILYIFGPSNKCSLTPTFTPYPLKNFDTGATMTQSDFHLFCINFVY